MTEQQLSELISVFETYPEMKLAYLFGSQATDNSGPLSDYDFAVYLDNCNQETMFEIKLQLLEKTSLILKTDAVDVVILNSTENPELKYNIIKHGQLIFEREPYRVLVEPKILNEYFDFHQILFRYHLTKG